MTVTANKMNGCVGSIRRERPVSLPLDDGACFCNAQYYSDLPDFLKPFNSQKDEIYRARVGTENQRLGGRASSRSLAGRHGLIYGMEAGRFKYWAGGVVGHAGLKKCPRMVVKRMRIDRFESCIRRFESGPAQNIHKAAGGPFGIAGGLFYWRRIMELSEAGRKVWERSYHPLYANNLGDGTAFVGEPGVPFGWVVAKDVLAALKTDLHDCNADELAHDAIYQAIALCNALGENGL